MAVLAACCFGWAYAFAEPDTVEALWPHMWSWAFLALAVALVAFFFAPWSKKLYLATGIYGPCLALLRVWAVIANNDAGVYASPRRFILGICTYVALGALWAAGWNTAVGPAHTWARQHRKG